jgi:hypothetical protein
MTIPHFRHFQFVAVLSLAPAVSLAETSVGDVQAAAVEWAQVRSDTVKLEKDWSFGKPFLEGTLDVRRTQMAKLESELAEARALAAKNKEDQTFARQRAQTAHAFLDAAETSLKETVVALRALRERMPPRLSDALTLSYKTLEDPGRPLAERWQAATVILNRSFQFDHSVVKSEELLSGDDKEPRLVETIYWGLAQGYALDRAGNRAWCANQQNGTWKWTDYDDPGAVALLLSIYSEKTDPQFVPLEARMSGTQTGEDK